MNSILKWILLIFTSILVGVTLYPLPAMISLPGGIRPGLEKLTLSQAVEELQGSGKTNWDLVESARSLVSERMHYSRRNSFEDASTAFERGYGFCQQQSYALMKILNEVGVDAKVVQAFRNKFPDGSTGGHAWVEVSMNGATWYIDTIFYDPETRMIEFTPLSPITDYSPLFRVVAGWGASAINAHRFYLTGKDWDT